MASKLQYRSDRNGDHWYWDDVAQGWRIVRQVPATFLRFPASNRPVGGESENSMSEKTQGWVVIWTAIFCFVGVTLFLLWKVGQ